jgi:hypothetical protein
MTISPGPKISALSKSVTRGGKTVKIDIYTEAGSDTVSGEKG